MSEAREGESRGDELLAAGEEALRAGESERAFALLDEAAQIGVAPQRLHQPASAYALAARYVSRDRQVLAWIDDRIGRADDPVLRAAFLRARIAVCRQVDVARVLELAPEALVAADAVDDEESYACVLSHAAFAGYRAGNPLHSWPEDLARF